MAATMIGKTEDGIATMAAHLLPSHYEQKAGLSIIRTVTPHALPVPLRSAEAIRVMPRIWTVTMMVWDVNELVEGDGEINRT